LIGDPKIRQLLVDTIAVNALRQVLEVGRAAGVVVVPVKGVVLCRWLYPSVGDRPYRDLDLLVERAALPPLLAAVKARGWTIRHVSIEMGELEFEVDRLAVEVHAEFGRRDLSGLSNHEVIARASPDGDTFPFEILRVDDIDHFLLLVANVIKKSYTYANPHQPADLERLLVRLEPRWDALVDRARAASFATALHGVAVWMASERQSAPFVRFLRVVPPGQRRLVPALLRLYRHLDRPHASRLESPSGLLGLVLATMTVDDWPRRRRALERLVRRGLYRRLGRNPG
jgi:hypothetical protein